MKNFWTMQHLVICIYMLCSHLTFGWAQGTSTPEDILFSSETWLNFELFNRSVRARRELDFTNRVGITPLMKIIQTSDVFVASSPQISFNEWTRRYRLKLVDLLVMHGASPNVTDSTGTTPLTSAVSQGDLELAERLIDAGAEINVQANLKSPLRFAVIYGRDANIVRLLLDHGAFVNELDFQGNTALHHSAISELAEIVKVLLEHGADSNIRNLTGKTALDLSHERRPFSKTTSLLSLLEGNVQK